MNERDQIAIIDLLVSKASFGIDEKEQAVLDGYFSDAGIPEDDSFGMAAAAFSIANLGVTEPMPEHLVSKILASGNEYISGLSSIAGNDVRTAADSDDYQKVFTIDRKRPAWGWFGWAVAAAACVVLAVNVWFTRVAPNEVSNIQIPPATPEKLTPEQEYAKLAAAPTGVVKANWAPPSPDAKELKDVSGDVVWSDAKQEGFMRLKGLPVNDKSKTTYQLWIFDKTQDPKTPIDGGTFDVDKNGEVIVPIDAKLKALEPALFAITIEKPGGVVVSDRKRIAALAKVEPQSKSST